MAGMDPLGDLPYRDEDNVVESIRAKRRYLDRQRRMRRLEQRKAASEASEFQQSLTEQGAAGAAETKPVLGVGDLRKAEADMAPKFETLDDYTKYIDDQEAEIKKARGMLDAYVKETAAMDARRNAKEVLQRKKIIAKNAEELAKADEWVTKARGSAKMAGTKQGVAEEPGFWKKALGTVSDAAGSPVIGGLISALSAPQENLAGIASLVAEGLSAVTPGENSYAEGSPIGLGDIIGATFDFTGEGALAQRGRDFNEKVGRTLGVAEDATKDMPVLGEAQNFIWNGPMGVITGGKLGAKASMEAGLGAAGMTEQQIQDMRLAGTFSLATDPLNVVDAAGGLAKPLNTVYQGLKTTRVGRQAIAKFPTLLVPEKAWLKLSGYAREASVLGKGKKLNDVYVAQQAFEKDAGWAVEKFKQDVVARQADYLNRLKGLPTGDAERVQEAVPLVVEHTDAATRANLINSAAERGDATSQLLYEMADDYAGDAEALKALENGKLNLQVTDLVDDINYFGRRFTPEVQDLIARNPEARDIIFATKMTAGRDAASGGWLAWEKGRKLKGMDFKEAEEAVRKSLLKSGVPVPGDMKIFSRDAFGDLVSRADRSRQTANVRMLYQNFAEHFGQMPEGAQATIVDLVQKMQHESTTRRPELLAKAQAELDAALQAQAAFREGRGALRSVADKPVSIPKKITKALDLVDPETTPRAAKLAQTLNPNNAADVAEFRAVLREELESSRGMAGRQADEMGAASARADELGIVTSESAVGSKEAYTLGREAQKNAVPVAEALVASAKANIHATPGAYEARAALAEARKLLKGANKQKDLEAAAEAIARAIGATPPQGGHDAVEAAKALVKYTREYIQNNPAIKDADKVMRQANAMLTKAREVASRVEVKTLADDISSLLRSANEANDVKAVGGKFLTRAMKKELEKAKAVIDDVRKWYNAVDLRKAGKEVEMPEVKAKSIREVRAALSKMRSELRKDAPAALRNMLDKAWRQSDKIAERVNAAKGAVGKDVATAVNRRVSQAQKALKKAEESYSGEWSPEAMAQWFSAHSKRVFGATEGGESALDILVRAKAPLPKTPEEIAQLAMTFVSTKDAKVFERYAKAHYWKHIDTPTKFWRTMDAIKGIYQRSVLSRPSSLTKDWQGTMINGAMSGNTPYLPRARAMLGSQKEWKYGGKTSDLVARLRGEGVLKNIVTEVNETQGTFRRVAMDLRQEGKAGRAKLLNKLAPIEEKGLLGGGLEMVGLKKTGAKVAKGTDAIMDSRAYVEELNRLASYMKAVDGGASHADAVEEVLTIWGKFDEMSRFDKNVMSRALFFWSWWARSIPISIRHILDRPVKARLLLTMMAGNVSDDESMPPWMRRMGGVMLGRDKSGNAKVLNLGSGSFMSPLMSVMQGEMATSIQNGNLAEAALGGAKDLLRSSPPYASEPLGALFQEDMFTGRAWWADEQNKVGSQIRAPMALRGLLGTPIGDKLGLKEYAPEDEIRYITIDPYWATVIGLTPGLEPVLGDVSSFMDPRQEDVAPGVSITKGLVRQAGFPVYSVPMDDKTARNAREAHSALVKAIDKNAPSLRVTGDYVGPDTTTFRGKKLKADWESYKQAAIDAGHAEGSDQFKLLVSRQLKANYPDEFVYIDIGEKLRWLKQMNDKGVAYPLNALNLRPRDNVERRIVKQGFDEAVRRRSRR